MRLTHLHIPYSDSWYVLESTLLAYIDRHDVKHGVPAAIQHMLATAVTLCGTTVIEQTVDVESWMESFAASIEPSNEPFSTMSESLIIAWFAATYPDALHRGDPPPAPPTEEELRRVMQTTRYS